VLDVAYQSQRSRSPGDRFADFTPSSTAARMRSGPGEARVQRVCDQPVRWSSRYALRVSENPVTIGDEVADHQVITRGGQIEAVVVPLEEYRALKALEQRETELYWAVHEARYPSRPGDDVPDGQVYDSMDALLADLGPDE
jgi:hypothetical protein